MLDTILVKKALEICYKAHEGQYDKGGEPYVKHPVFVAEQMDDEYLVCVALLHDVVEDTEYTLQDLITCGFPDEIIEAVKCITKEKGMDYMDYIKIVKTNPMATKVKLKDLEHNSDLSRLKHVDESAYRRLEKYKKAKEYLLS